MVVLEHTLGFSRHISTITDSLILVGVRGYACRAINLHREVLERAALAGARRGVHHVSRIRLPQMLALASFLVVPVYEVVQTQVLSTNPCHLVAEWD